MEMREAYICDAIRTPIGTYGGSLSGVRTDDLAARSITALIERNTTVDWARVDDVMFGCANQAGEDNRNVARMAALLAGLPVEVPGVTLNRLCGSGMNAVGSASQAIKLGEAELIVAGGVESMSRAPYVMSKGATPYARNVELFDTTIGWRFVNRLMKEQYGIDSMPETAETVAEEFGVSREDQDAFALRSQQRTAQAASAGYFSEEIVPVFIPQRRGDDIVVDRDEHPRPESTLEGLAKLKPPFRANGTVTAGNS
jgi:acetyl-CoA acyltransferase